MIKRLKLLRNLGQFENEDSGGSIPLSRLTLCYAGNARGKTTLAAVSRSLASGDPIPMLERRRVNSPGHPRVAIETDSPQGICHFTDGEWNGTRPNVVVFDDEFIEQNICSGLSVSSQQRQNLHDVILGPDAVALQRRLNEQVQKIEQCNSELRSKETLITARILGDLNVHEICMLPEDAQVDDNIRSIERLITAAKEQKNIQNASPLNALSLPHFDLERIEQVLNMGLDDVETEAMNQVHMHMEHLGDGAADWLSEGMGYVKDAKLNESNTAELCPFCGQDLKGTQLIRTYRRFFSDEYEDLKRAVADLIRETSESFGDRLRAQFEQELRVSNESRAFWKMFVDIEPLSLASDDIFEDCALAREKLVDLMIAKQSAPLEKLKIPEEVRHIVDRYGKHVSSVDSLSPEVDDANRRIDEFKARLTTSNVDDLERKLILKRATKIRHSPDVATLCDEFLATKGNKAEAESARDGIRTDLDQYRRNTFHEYQEIVNGYLETFGASFRLDELRPANIRSGSTSTFGVVINRTFLNVTRTTTAEPAPSFGTVFSAGDRATLALAFFFASIDKMNNQGELVVVLDDPISSMDGGRTLATAQVVRHLTSRVAQVIVLSHNKEFLCQIMEQLDNVDMASMQIIRRGEGSSIEQWDIRSESHSEHDRRNNLFNSYLSKGHCNEREIAFEIRNHLEGFLRIAYPSEFPPGTALGKHFISACEEQLGKPEQILSEDKFNELCQILEYANSFHHDSNPAWKSQAVDTDELVTYVKRTLKFTRP